ncbi:MAG: hypothetical protein R2822_30435 [Spirosomataceae bacterium]
MSFQNQPLMISLKRLDPEQADERRFYVATGGQPGGKQVAFLQEILSEIPQAQLVIAQDMIMPGYGLP